MQLESNLNNKLAEIWINRKQKMEQLQPLLNGFCLSKHQKQIKLSLNLSFYCDSFRIHLRNKIHRCVTKPIKLCEWNSITRGRNFVEFLPFTIFIVKFSFSLHPLCLNLQPASYRQYNLLFALIIFRRSRRKMGKT